MRIRSTEVCTSKVLFLHSYDTDLHFAYSLGLRPYGVSAIYAGWDTIHDLQLYHSDPSGNYGGWKATCIGENNTAAQSILKQDYKPEITLTEAIGLAVKVLAKTMDSTTLASEKRRCQQITSQKLK